MKNGMTRARAELKSLGASLWNSAFSSAREISEELKRLNHGGAHYTCGAPTSRRQQAREFKAALAEHYEQHARCCC
jgi:hypothetical protein